MSLNLPIGSNNGYIITIEISWREAFWQSQQRGGGIAMLEFHNNYPNAPSGRFSKSLGIVAPCNNFAYTSDSSGNINIYYVRGGGNSLMGDIDIRYLNYLGAQSIAFHNTEIAAAPSGVIGISYNNLPDAVSGNLIAASGTDTQFVKGDGSLSDGWGEVLKHSSLGTGIFANVDKLPDSYASCMVFYSSDSLQCYILACMRCTRTQLVVWYGTRSSTSAAFAMKTDWTWFNPVDELNVRSVIRSSAIVSIGKENQGNAIDVAFVKTRYFYQLNVRDMDLTTVTGFSVVDIGLVYVFHCVNPAKVANTRNVRTYIRDESGVLAVNNRIGNCNEKIMLLVTEISNGAPVFIRL
jgi:hypothetical protein